MKSISCIIVGFIICTIGLCFVTGSVEDAFSVWFLSIVCTAGIGLVVLLPLWWTAGAIAIGTYGLLFPTSEDEEQDVSSSDARSDDRSIEQTSLIQYLRKAKLQGFRPEETTKTLLDLGWSHSEIQAAIQSIASSQTEA
jgi:hypothetical protein